MKKMVLFNVTPINTDVRDLKEFERKVIKAKELGATHILVTEVIKSNWIWERDLSDPYSNWGNLNSGLFKILLPDELKKYIPNDYCEKNLELVKKRTEILRKHGLKAWAYFCEPFYLPEEVYRDHPSWRGPRCDHPRRSRNAYYSPCMDNEEVLAIYRKTFAKLCEIADIDYLYLHTNDCGAGICWSNGLYDGPNGPEECKHIPMASRILNYFRVFKDSAKEAGRDLFIETNAKIGFKKIDPEMENVWRILDDGMAVNFKTNKGTPLSSLIDINYEFTIAPVRCIPEPLLFVEQLEKAYKESTDILKVVYLDDDFDIQARLYKAFIESPTNGPVDRMNLLLKVAKEIYPNDPQKLVDMWCHINNGLNHLYATLMEGFTWTSINQRLINRPFVLFPQELTNEEKDYYQKYQFQATTLENSYDLLDNQGSAFVKGYHAVFMASKAIDKALAEWKDAIKLSKEFGKEFELQKDRLELLCAFAVNYQNAMNFQELVDETNYEETPVITSHWPDQGDDRLLTYESLNRKEIDNTYKIISLIENREREMLVLAPTAKEEDIFWLSPDIVNQLKKKVQIMQDRVLEGKRLYKSKNL